VKNGKNIENCEKDPILKEEKQLPVISNDG